LRWLTSRLAVVGVRSIRKPLVPAMDAQQLDLFLRHQSMANVCCESEVGASLCLYLCPPARPNVTIGWFCCQDALGSSESEPARPARPRGKRSRAAEVHNLSEKVGAWLPLLV